MAEVRYELDGDVAVITIDNPPVNALGFVVREGIAAALERLRGDASARAGVVIGERVFIAGADIKEFGQPPKGPPLPELCDRLEACDKPLVAAIAGNALGGGLEVALGCHFRVAVAEAKVGLPEVNLGILPGAGGTQRLPRIVGPQIALDVIQSGKPMAARRALELGVIDAIVEGDLKAQAVAYARAKADAGGPLPRASELTDNTTGVDPELFDAYRRKNAAKWRGLVAPWKIVDCVEAACTRSFAAGMAFERAAFLECVNSPARAALIHLFFAERAAAKVPGVGPEVKPRPVRSVAVLGAGTMGGGISMAFANAGIPVQVLDVNPEALARGRALIDKNYATSVSRGSTSQAAADAALGRITTVGDFAQIADADLVVEAVFEEMGVKKEVFARLDAVMKPGAVLATNTSYLDVDEIAAATARPQDVVGTHFFSPANIMRLQENVRGEKSSPEVLATVTALAKTLGKVAVMAGNRHGFIGNRILSVYGRESDFLLEEGATPTQIDAALMDFGFPMGMYRMRDMAGLDIGYKTRKAAAATRDPAQRYSTIADQLVEMGRLGQKSGSGYYRYEAGNRNPIPDPEVEALVKRTAAEAGFAPREIGADEIVNTLLAAMVNEGAKVIAEGVAARASDIDIVYVYGYGFPRWQGGPMFWAQARGLDKVLADVERLHAAQGDRWAPAPLLVERAKLGTWA